MVTINDVAKRAGVSRGTVSNVINHVKVRPGSQEKVEAAIRELGYVPNAYARSLKSQKTNTIAFILPTVWFPFFSELTNDLEQELRLRGYKMLLCNSHNDYNMELDYIQMAKENKVAGIISITYSDIEQYLTSNIPLVTIERYFNSKIPFISVDNFEGGRLAAKKLSELGCKKLNFIGRLAEKDSVTSLRREGFVSYCREQKIPYEELYSTSPSKVFIEEVEEYIKAHYVKNGFCDGIFAATDRYAEYILDDLERCGSERKVGEDLQIIGFDGAKSHQNQRTVLSTIRQPVEEIAKRAVDVIDAMIQGEEVPMYQLISAEFWQGKTTRRQD